MITYSIIKKSQLEGAHRIDAEYYQPQYLQTKEILLRQKTRQLLDVAAVTDGNHLTISEQFSDVGVRYLRGKDLNDFFISDTDPVYIPESAYEHLHRSYIFQKDVLVSIVGTVGLISLAVNDYDKLTGSCKIAILHTKRVDPWFLATFLSSRFGQDQIQRLVAGAVQTGIILQDLGVIRVPDFNEKAQSQIAEITQSAYKVQKQSKKLLIDAEKLLFAELALSQEEEKSNLSFTVSLKNIISAHRIDADYFQPKYERLIESLQKNNPKQLGEIVSMKKGFEPGSEAYQEEGKSFLRVSSFSTFGLTERVEKFLRDDLYQTLKKDYEPKMGEILLTKDGSPGVAYVLKEQVEGIISGGILRLKLKEKVDPEYLALCINSIVGKMQVERDAGGSIIAHWRPEQIKKMIIPILPPEKQKEIADHVRQSHEARKKAKGLLEEAKKKVEEMIEKS